MSIRKLNLPFSLHLVALFVVFFLASSCKPTAQNNDSDIHTIYLVRHAEKADDGTKDPPLTEKGENRANALAQLLKDKNIEKIYSTDYKRTRNTAEPLAKLIGVDVEIYQPNDEEFAKSLKEVVKSTNVLVVGHSNSTPTLVNKIMDFEDFKQLDESVYNMLFVITLDNRNNLKVNTETYFDED